MESKNKPTAAEIPAACDTRVQLIYCGPTLPDGTLSENAVLLGTRAELTAHCAAALAAYPQIRTLLVPIAQLAETKRRIRTPGNLAHKHFCDIAAALRGERGN